jgi:hypothetical protein
LSFVTEAVQLVAAEDELIVIDETIVNVCNVFGLLGVVNESLIVPKWWWANRIEGLSKGL